jgi:competence protein ComFC
VHMPTLDVCALGVYEDGLRRAILALKDGRRDVARSMGLRLARLVDGTTQLVPVPTTRSRKAVRGFDGAELLAQVCAGASGARARLLLRQSAGDAQRGRAREARLAARGRFTCGEADLEGQEFVLLDDVMTTGSTLEDCASTLRSANGLVRSAIVVAYSTGRGCLKRRDYGGPSTSSG